MTLVGEDKDESDACVMGVVKGLVRQRFDPSKLQHIFQAKSTPSWLNDVINDATWRDLWYTLGRWMERRRCLHTRSVLRFSVQTVCAVRHATLFVNTS